MDKTKGGILLPDAADCERAVKAQNVFANEQKREQKRTRLAELDVVIEAQIMEYNNLATEMDGDLDIIVAYKMTHDDLDKMMEEVFENGESESKDSK